MKLQRFTAFLLIVLSAIVTVTAQMFNPVKWSSKIEMTSDNTGEVVFTATIDAGWHMYSHDCDPQAGPSPLSINFSTLKGAVLEGDLKADRPSTKVFDKMFEADLNFWENGITLRQAFKATEPEFSIDGTIRYAACNDENCIPPGKEPFELSGTAKINAAARRRPLMPLLPLQKRLSRLPP